MSVYTAYEMIADCRTGKPDGWLWFARTLVPPLRVLLAHYAGEQADGALRRLLNKLRDELGSMEPATVRELVVALRPRILEAAGYPGATARKIPDAADVTGALEPLTNAERQIVWLETMGYDHAATARLMRASVETVESVRRRAGELLRAALDEWTVTLLRDEGHAIGEEIRGTPPEEPVPTRQYLDVVDGRVTWQGRTDVDRKLAASWYEIDHVCRVREADDAVSAGKPLDDAAAGPYYSMFGVEPPKPSLWKRVFS